MQTKKLKLDGLDEKEGEEALEELDDSVLEEKREIPEPMIYFGNELKKFETTKIYKDVPAFTQAWILRLMMYKFALCSYVTKRNLSKCLHGNLRRKHLGVSFGINWVWKAVGAMARPPEDKKEYCLIEFVEGRRESFGSPDKVDNQGPTAIRLTPFGKEIASKLGEGPKKLSVVQPEPQQRLFEESSQLSQYSQMESQAQSSFTEFGDLREIYEKVDHMVRIALSEVANMRRFILPEKKDETRAVMVLKQFGESTPNNNNSVNTTELVNVNVSSLPLDMTNPNTGN